MQGAAPAQVGFKLLARGDGTWVGNVGRIVVVDGCPLNCARKIVEQAGYHPGAAITLVNDCGIKKGPPTQYTADDLAVATDAILAALRDGHGGD